MADEPVVLIDSDFDAGFNPFVGNWGPLKNAPSNCNLQIDYSPDVDISPFTWQACASVRAGCQRLVIDWTTNRGTQIGFEWQPVRTINGVVYINYQRIFPEISPSAPAAAGMNIVADMNGHAYLATGAIVSPTYCVASYLTTKPVAGFFGGTVDNAFMLGSAAWGDTSSTQFHIKTQSDLGVLSGMNGGNVQRADSNGNTLFLDTSDPFSITLYDIAQDKITLVQDPASQNRIPAEDPIVVKDGILAQDTSALQGLWFIRTDGSAARVYTPQNKNLVFAEDVDSANSDTFVWMEGQLGSGFDYTNVALYTSPYTTQKDGVIPKRVTGISSLFNYGGFMVTNAGMALVMTSSTTAELIRLSDGWAWSLTAEQGDNWQQALWVDDNEVWISVTAASSGGAFTTDIVKFQRANLGAPTMAPQ